MKKVLWFGTLFLLVFLSACGSSATPLSGSSSTEPGAAGSSTTSAQPAGEKIGPAELQYIFDIPADPLRVVSGLDSPQRVEAVIPVTGGSLSANGADGTSYRLDIPEGALVADTLVKMTPVSSLEGMTLGSSSYAVQLEPEGLAFYAPAILTITPAQELPIDQQIFFGYQGDGENLVLAPPAMQSTEIQIQIFHFSGYGVTKGFLADIEPVRARIGGDAEARLQSAIAEYLSRVRQAQLLGTEYDTDVDWEGLFQQWEDQVVRPRLAAAGESCAAGRLAINTILSYERQRQLLGVGDGSLDSALISNGLLNSVAETCMREEYELCRDEHIIHLILPAWLTLQRQYALLGMAGEGEDPAVLESAKNYVRRCLSFELEFHSEVNFDDGDGGGYDSAVDSKIKIQIIPDELKMRGQAPLVNTDFVFRVPDCTVTSNRAGGTFEATSLSYVPDTKTPTDKVGYVRDFKLIYYPGDTAENFTVTCPDAGSFSPPAAPLWTGAFLLAHEGELSQSEGGFVAENWEILGGEYYAKKEWIIDDAANGIVEAGTFKLYHRPE